VAGPDRGSDPRDGRLPGRGAEGHRRPPPRHPVRGAVPAAARPAAGRGDPHPVRGSRSRPWSPGEGPPVVLLHGLGANKVSFLPTVSALADRHEVHALDLPGFGRSRSPLPTGRRYSMPWFADVVNGYLIARGWTPRTSSATRWGAGSPWRWRCATHGRSTDRGARTGRRVRPDPADRARCSGYAEPLDGGWRRCSPPRRRSRAWCAACSPTPTSSRRSTTARGRRRGGGLAGPGHRLAVLAAARHLGMEPGTGRGAYWRRLRSPDRAELLGLRRGGPARGQPLRSPGRRRGARREVETWPGVGHVPQFEAPTRVAAAVDDVAGADRSRQPASGHLGGRAVQPGHDRGEVAVGGLHHRHVPDPVELDVGRRRGGAPGRSITGRPIRRSWSPHTSRVGEVMRSSASSRRRRSTSSRTTEFVAAA
jgi:pimeloyl-ACP methyl ester carboxylesterase